MSAPRRRWRGNRLTDLVIALGAILLTILLTGYHHGG